MLVSELKTDEEVNIMLQGNRFIFITGCNGCADVSLGGIKKVLQDYKCKFESIGKTVTGIINVDFLCYRMLTSINLLRNKEIIEKSDAIVVFSCGIGVQVVASCVDRYVIPAMNTLSTGGTHGLWPGEEKCYQCGNCYLGYTAGICPITGCAKSLLNGPCGGTNSSGECEIRDGRPCAWLEIYKRLKTRGLLNLMKKIHVPRDKSKIIPPKGFRNTLYWSINQKIKDAICIEKTGEGKP